MKRAVTEVLEKMMEKKLIVRVVSVNIESRNLLILCLEAAWAYVQGSAWGKKMYKLTEKARATRGDAYKDKEQADKEEFQAEVSRQVGMAFGDKKEKSDKSRILFTAYDLADIMGTTALDRNIILGVMAVKNFVSDSCTILDVNQKAGAQSHTFPDVDVVSTARDYIARERKLAEIAGTPKGQALLDALPKTKLLSLWDTDEAGGVTQKKVVEDRYAVFQDSTGRSCLKLKTANCGEGIPAHVDTVSAVCLLRLPPLLLLHVPSPRPTNDVHVPLIT